MALVVIGGLPGVGKSTVARLVADGLGAALLRIDTIERAIAASGDGQGPVGAAGYVVAYALAEDNLRGGRPVVVDGVNPVDATRSAFRGVGARCGAAVLEVELVCGDVGEHRRRVEARRAEQPEAPGWADVLGRGYEQWDRDRLVIDTAELPEACAQLVLERLTGDM